MQPSPETLQALVDEAKVSDVLELVTLDDIAEAWCRYTRRALDEARDDSDDPDWWAIELWMTREWWGDSARVRDGVLALVRAAAADDVLACVGAGPLENCLSADESTLRWVEEQAAHSSQFRTALASVWVWDDLPPSAAERIEAAAGVPLD